MHRHLREFVASDHALQPGLELRVQRMLKRARFAIAALFATSSAMAAETVIPLTGEVPSDEARHFYLPFSVPEGIVEIEIQHDDLSEENILDWGLEDADGFRGWGGGNTEPAVVGIDAASRSYVPGPIAAGQWRVVVGKAQIKATPAMYDVKVILRDVATLPPQPERQPYAPPAPLATGERWYAGDFHVHSRESGDAEPTLDEIAVYAKSQDLDFALISDHNTNTQLDFYATAQAAHPDFLFLPGMEFTTYWGHANAIGSTLWVDDKVELPGNSVEQAAQSFRDQGALFSVNHPTLDLGDLCIGCAWTQELPVDFIDAVEVQTGNVLKLNAIIGDSAIDFWDELLDQGKHLPAIGGSDDHRAGDPSNFFSSTIGDPTTLVFAQELSVQGIVEGVKRGRTVVKMDGPTSPMIELTSNVAPQGDTVTADVTTFVATVTGGIDHQVRFVRDGELLEEVDVTSDPFVHELELQAPLSGELRVRAEALQSGIRRTLTSHLWLEKPPPAGAASEGDGGCGCRVGAVGRAGSVLGGLALACAAFLGRRFSGGRRPGVARGTSAARACPTDDSARRARARSPRRA